MSTQNLPVRPPTNLPKTRLHLDAVSACYPEKKNPVFEDLSLEVHAGEIVVLLGRSGCGKTTLLNIASGLQKPAIGNVARPERIGYVMQKDLLLPWRTNLKNILLPLEISGIVTEQDRSRAEYLLAIEGLQDMAQAYPEALSGGMRQKISLIRMQLMNPDLILLDEPFSALDYDTRLQAEKKLRMWILAENKAALFVTHDIEEAISIADRILVLGSEPTKIVFHTVVTLTEGERDPQTIRTHPAFQNMFKTLWEKLREKK